MKYLNIKKALAAWQGLQPLSEKDSYIDFSKKGCKVVKMSCHKGYATCLRLSKVAKRLSERKADYDNGEDSVSLYESN